MEHNTNPWWIDYGTMELVRTEDGRRWRVEHVPPLAVVGPVDVDKVDQWVLAQPQDRT